MRISIKNLLIGLLAGVALTLAALSVAARMYNEHLLSRSNPKYTARQLALSAGVLPAPLMPPPPDPVGAPHAYDDWALMGLDGEHVRLGDLRGRVVFLTLSATYCGPCIAELPSVEKLAESLRKQPVSFLFVTGEEEQVVRKFLEENTIPLPVYFRGKSAPAPFETSGMPRTYILDKAGTIRYTRLGAANWNEAAVREYVQGLARLDAAKPAR